MQEHIHADPGEEHIYSTLQRALDKVYKFLEACLTFFLVSAIVRFHFHVFFTKACHHMALLREWLAIPATALHNNIFHDTSLLLAYNPSAFLSKSFLKTDTCNHCLTIGNISAPVSSQCHSQSPASAGQRQPTFPPSFSPKAAVPTSSP